MSHIVGGVLSDQLSTRLVELIVEGDGKEVGVEVYVEADGIEVDTIGAVLACRHRAVPPLVDLGIGTVVDGG